MVYLLVSGIVCAARAEPQGLRGIILVTLDEDVGIARFSDSICTAVMSGFGRTCSR